MIDKLNKSKKGIVSVAITVGTLLALSVVLIILFGGSLAVINFISNIGLQFIGGLMLGGVAITLVLGRPLPKMVTQLLFFGGMILVLLPMLLPGLQEVSLASVGLL